MFIKLPKEIKILLKNNNIIESLEKQNQELIDIIDNNKKIINQIYSTNKILNLSKNQIELIKIYEELKDVKNNCRYFDSPMQKQKNTIKKIELGVKIVEILGFDFSFIKNNLPKFSKYIDVSIISLRKYINNFTY